MSSHDWRTTVEDPRTGFKVESCTKCGATQSTGNPETGPCTSQQEDSK